MKLSVLQSDRVIQLTTESPDDIFTMGRLSVKLKARTSPSGRANEQREMQCELKDLLKLAAE
jgi:hypothetical protein